MARRRYLSARGGSDDLRATRPPCAGLCRPLGIAIVVGLLFSQLLTLYTTPVVYLYLDRFRLRWEALRSRRRPRREAPAPSRA